MVDVVVHLHEIADTDVARVGGKAARLGALTRIEGVRVPPGFCVTTDAWRRVVGGAPELVALIERLGESGDAPELCAEIRRAIEAVAIPDELAAAITVALVHHGVDADHVVRSSATAEDLPTASFAGQHDSFLGVRGPAAILTHVRRCWASLFSARAVAYRRHHRVDHRDVRMAVVVQRMLSPRASGVLFTADPVSGNRRTTRIEASSGLGEALVSGRVDPDVYEVRDGALARSAPGASLGDAEVLRLAALGRTIEAHFDEPQDVEWCLVDDAFHVVQSRSITTLFPIPVADGDGPRVYLSVGHQQMMTDPMRPLGLSLFQRCAARAMYEAGGRLFVDVSAALATPSGQAALLDTAGRSDPLTRDALERLIARGFVPAGPGPTPPAAPVAVAPLPTDPSIPAALVARGEASIAALARAIAGRSGPALIEFILDDLDELRRLLFDPQGFRVIMAAMESSWWLDDHLRAWLGETAAAAALAQSVDDNPTSAMGLALLEVADAIRPHAHVVALLRGVGDDDGFLDAMLALPGGDQARAAIDGFLARYGMRGVGEIDITRPRWSERPSLLVPMLLADVDGCAPGAAARRFARGRADATEVRRCILERLRARPDGAELAEQVEQHIDRMRAFLGYREYPKFAKIKRFGIYKQALMAEADRLVEAGVLHQREDLFYLRIDELLALTRDGRVDHRMVARRKAEWEAHARLAPPRVLTSEGETLNGSYRRVDAPAGALLGLAVSPGVVEGRARVMLEPGGADLRPGDILVTTYTDPSWTPVFVAIAGLVTEVGGLMTHGAVVAREYGLPAIVGVHDATRRIRDGARIRLDADAGHVELV